MPRSDVDAGAITTRLRRLRGLVANRVAESAGTLDEIQVVVQRGALTLDSDLDPDVDLVRAAERRGLAGGPPSGRSTCVGGDGIRVRSRTWIDSRSCISWLRTRRDAEAVLAGLAAGDHDEAVRARIAFPAGEQHALGPGRP